MSRNPGQIVGVLGRADARYRHSWVSKQPLQQFHRLGRGRNQLPWPISKPQTELQHVEARLGMFPFRQLVAPRSLELRTSQAFGILRGKYLGHRAIVPNQATPACLEARAVMPGNRHDAGRTFDHHLANVTERLTDQGDAPMPSVGEW
jgi:hypothetical protein